MRAERTQNLLCARLTYVASLRHEEQLAVPREMREHPVLPDRLAREFLRVLVKARLLAGSGVAEHAPAVALDVPAARLSERDDVTCERRGEGVLLIDTSARTLDERPVVGDDRHIDAECLSDRQCRLEHTPRRNCHGDSRTHGALHRCDILC